MDWSFTLPSYSYSKNSNYTGVKSNVYGIRVPKKSVLYNPSPYFVSGGPSLRFRDFAVITSLLLPIQGKVGYCSLLLPHWSLLPGYFPPLKVISCVIVTIKRFVFFSFPFDCISLLQLLFCFFLFFGSKWPFKHFSEIWHHDSKFWKWKLPEYSDPLFLPINDR